MEGLHSNGVHKGNRADKILAIKNQIDYNISLVFLLPKFKKEDE